MIPFDYDYGVVDPAMGFSPSGGFNRWGVGNNMGWGMMPYMGGGGAMTSFMPSGTQNRLQELRQEAIRPLAPLMSADLIESENDFHVHVDLPGVENIDINTDNNFLTITADRKVLHEIDSDVAHTVERSSGKVKRRLPIPRNADVEHAKAKFRDGVLTVTFPKKEPSAPAKKIRVD
jgi:HSP20 family protein